MQGLLVLWFVIHIILEVGVTIVTFVGHTVVFDTDSVMGRAIGGHSATVGN